MAGNLLRRTEGKRGTHLSCHVAAWNEYALCSWTDQVACSRWPWLGLGVPPTLAPLPTDLCTVPRWRIASALGAAVPSTASTLCR